ncbi:MAG: hypothetical protein AB7E31_01955 [Desulfitobacterium sp.]
MVSFSLVLLLGIALVAVILIIGAIAISLRAHSRGGDPSEQKEGGKIMIKTVYTYLILFATLMMTIGGSVAAFMATADLVAPQSYYMSFEDFKRGQIYDKGVNEPKAPAIEKSDEELKADYQRLVDEEKARSRERALNSLIKSFGWIVIPLPVFLYYQRRMRHE